MKHIRTSTRNATRTGLCVVTLAFGLAACKNSAPGAGIKWASYPALTQTTTSFRWLVVKCQLSDVSAIPIGLDTSITKFFGIGGAGYGNMVDYFHDVSYNRASVIADTFVGWVTAPISTADLTFPNGKFATAGARVNRVQACLQAIAPDQLPDLTAFQGVIVINNAIQDGGACSTGAVTLTVSNVKYSLACVWFDANSLSTEFAMHEIGHGIGLQHAYDDSGRICANVAKPGEYCDPWDIMSAQITAQFVDRNWPIGGNPSGGGPGLSAPGLLKMGWLPADNQRRYQIENGEETHVLRALSRPRAGAPMVVILDVGSETPFEGIYTIEYRQADGWDRGFATSTRSPGTVRSSGGVVLVHQFRLAGAPTSTLINGAYGGALQPCNTMVLRALGGGTFHVTVASLDTTAGEATILIGPGRGRALKCTADLISQPRRVSPAGDALAVDTAHLMSPH
jgi:hypothetical protein